MQQQVLHLTFQLTLLASWQTSFSVGMGLRTMRYFLAVEGILLRKRAEDLVKMADKITTEFLALDDVLGSDVYFGLAESYQIRYLAAGIRKLKKCPPVCAIISPMVTQSRHLFNFS